jgi:hypothetical protein
MYALHVLGPCVNCIHTDTELHASVCVRATARPIVLCLCVSRGRVGVGVGVHSVVCVTVCVCACICVCKDACVGVHAYMYMQVCVQQPYVLYMYYHAVPIYQLFIASLLGLLVPVSVKLKQVRVSNWFPPGEH